MIGDDKKIQFSDRLNSVLDDHQFPPKNMGRISWLAKMFSTTHKGAGNWVNGKAIPSRKTLKVMSDKFNVSEEWLQFGEKAGPKSKIISVPILAKSEILHYVTQHHVDFPVYLEVQDTNSNHAFAVDLGRGEFELAFVITQKGQMVFDPDKAPADKLFALVSIAQDLFVKRLIEFDKGRYAVQIEHPQNGTELHPLSLPNDILAIMTEVKF